MASPIRDLGDMYLEEVDTLIAWHAGQLHVLRQRDLDNEGQRQLKFHDERLRARKNFLHNERKVLTSHG